MNNPRIGMVGVGRFGQNHSRILAAAPWCDYRGLFDLDPDRRKEIAGRDGCNHHDSLDSLLEQCDGVVIAVDTASHFSVAEHCLKAGMHVLVEKPICNSIHDARTLIDVAKSHDLHLRVGHLERFNPAISAGFSLVDEPISIRIERHGVWSPRRVSADVVIDLMIHDLDSLLVHDLGLAEVVDARAVTTVSEYPDRCECTLRFAGGALAQLSANRSSHQRRRMMELCDANQQVFVDMIEQHCKTYQNRDGSIIETDNSPEPARPLDEELRAFCALLGNQEPVQDLATGEDGYQALKLAQSILSVAQS